jgi:GNAT superfamily N-acetyltransferase
MTEQATTDDYEIRWFRPADRPAFLSLYSSVFDGERSEEWFAWKFEENPYVDHVPVLVATNGDELVGARAFFALPVDVGGERDVALQPCDTMVHADHRRRGLFTRMTERAIERYRGEYPFFFNFPNHLTLQGNLDLGWRIVGERTSHYRLEDPGRVAESRTNRTLVRFGAGLAAPLLRRYNRFRDRRAPSADVPVRVDSRPPVEELAALYRRAVPEGIHAVRDEQFYRWRLDTPHWEYTTYVAEGDGGPAGAVVAGTSTDEGPERTKLIDVVPLGAAPDPALVALLERVLSERADTAMFVAPGGAFPDALLAAFGFHADRSSIFAPVANPTTLVARSLTGEWDRHGLSLDDPDDWLLTFAEEDSS